MRLDQYLVSKQIYESRQKAWDAIKAGKVLINGRCCSRPAQAVGAADAITLSVEAYCPFVSKGGLKLQRAVDVFQLDFKCKTVLDIGASTGGFTDCALQNGAAKVWAIDVGTAQLHPALKEDPRIISIENCDIRTLQPENLGIPLVDRVVCDVSFISLSHILPHISRFLKPDGEGLFLVKPQFEAGPGYTGKRGVVKDARVQVRVVEDVISQAREAGLRVSGLDHAPLPGAGKNIEYLLWCGPDNHDNLAVKDIVAAAFAGQAAK
jgi:23S rRNA (cytidine1920-2'-O)/16S rRNA (cytidine1409-2'-O)-methyltransferase